MEKDYKTEIQRDIEKLVTGERSYTIIPHSKIFGEKFALNQWLKFSARRMIESENNVSEKVSFLVYFRDYNLGHFQESLREKLDALREKVFNDKKRMDYIKSIFYDLDENRKSLYEKIMTD